MVSLTLLLALSGTQSEAAPAPQHDTVTVGSGTYYHEEIFPPTDGSPWHGQAFVANASTRVDFYIIRTTDLVSAYPRGSFAPVVAAENVTEANLSFRPLVAGESYSFIIDNLDNTRVADATPTSDAQVSITRTPPFRSNPEAQALLATGATICAGVLAVATVAVAVFLKRRPKREEEIDLGAPAVEVDVPIPKPPVGAWSRAEPEEPPLEDAP